VKRGREMRDEIRKKMMGGKKRGEIGANIYMGLSNIIFGSWRRNQVVVIIIQG
jgi:hypothetical protein